MDAVIGHDDLKQTVALVTRHTEKVHIGKIHAHYKTHTTSLGRHEEVTVERRRCTEATGTQIETTAWSGTVVEVWIKTEKAGEAHEENKMEIGKTVGTAVKPLYAVGDIIEKRLILLLATQCVVKKFGHEKRDRKLVWVGSHRRQRT